VACSRSANPAASSSPQSRTLPSSGLPGDDPRSSPPFWFDAGTGVAGVAGVARTGVAGVVGVDGTADAGTTAPTGSAGGWPAAIAAAPPADTRSTTTKRSKAALSADLSGFMPGQPSKRSPCQDGCQGYPEAAGAPVAEPRGSLIRKIPYSGHGHFSPFRSLRTFGRAAQTPKVDLSRAAVR
jgi:hypothetical protein